jgi:hypothetical protein
MADALPRLRRRGELRRGPEKDGVGQQPSSNQIAARKQQGGARHRRKGDRCERPTRKCSHCGERFALTPRRGRNSDKRHATQGTRSYHLGARYCKEACRKAASKARRRSSTVARKAEKTLPLSALLSSVTRAKNSLDVSSQYEGKKTGRGSCLIGPHDYPINVLGGYRFPQAKPVPEGVP